MPKAKKYFIKFYSYLITFYLLSSIFMHAVQAQNDLQLRYKIPNPSRYDSLESLVSAATGVIRPVFIITFGAMILYSAFLITTARANEEQIENAKKTLGAAIIGFAIAVFAPSIANILLGFIGVDGFGQDPLVTG